MKKIMRGQEMANLVLLMYQEVVGGRLLLRTPERVALIENWHDVLHAHIDREDFCKVTKDLFLTLPLKNQYDLLEKQEASYINFIDASSLAILVKKNFTAMSWPVVEGNSRQDQAGSGKVGDEVGRPDNSLYKRRKKSNLMRKLNSSG